jgi:hypothetical protein
VGLIVPQGAAMLCKESYTGLTADELSFEKGDVLTFIESDESGLRRVGIGGPCSPV